MSRTRLMSRLRSTLRGTSRSDAPGLTRRELVELGLLAGVAPAIGACNKSDNGKVVVVGAGIAGLHCAYRLAKEGVDVTLHEASDRVGGRMWTGRGLFASGLDCELGGELIDTNHLTLFELSEELDIALDDRFAAETPGMVRDTWFVGGRAVPEEEIVEQWAATASTFAKDFQAAEGTDEGYERLDLTPLDEYLDFAVPPSSYPELNAVFQAAYRGEFGLENSQQSALNLIYLIDAVTTDSFRIFGDSDERYHTRDGNDTFTTRLADGIPADRIVLRSSLVAVRDRDGGGYELDFSDSGGGLTVVEADHVVFALPFTTLREVQLDTKDLKARKQRIIDELGYGTNAKVMGGFTRRPWWDDLNASGSATTDLPLQQTWDTTIGQDGGGAGILTNFLGGDIGLASDEGTDVERFEAVLGDLDVVFPGSAAAFDGTAVRMHWPSHPQTKGSYTCYTPGQWAFWSQEGRRNGNLHFCGEHTSLDFQGWMEGGAETGALVAAEILDDLGVSRTGALARIVAAKTLAPQACYHGDLLPERMRPLARRRDLMRRLGWLTGQ